MGCYHSASRWDGKGSEGLGIQAIDGDEEQVSLRFGWLESRGSKEVVVESITGSSSCKQCFGLPKIKRFAKSSKWRCKEKSNKRWCN